MLSIRDFFSSLRQSLFNTLGGRLLASILLCSSLITLITTGVQLYIEYRKDVQNTERIVQHTCKSHLSAVAEDLWSVDLRKIELTLKQIIQSPDIRYLEVRDKDNVLIRVGQALSEDVFVQTFPLVYEDKLEKEHIGFLSVSTSYVRIRQRLLSQVFVILSTQAIKTFIVSLFILIIFRYMVTRHLVNMAQYAKSLDMKKLDRSLVLRRREKLSKKPDELDQVVQAVNQMRHSLLNSFTEMETKNSELRKMDRLKDQFLANTSHELKTPLNGIIGIVESMIEGALGPVSTKLSHNLSLVQSSGRRLFYLVDDILDFSKLKNSDIKLNLTEVDVYSAVNTVLTLVGHLVENKPLELINTVPADSAIVAADENRLSQILHNIIGNAIKFTESGSVEIRAQASDRFLLISISDTGIGISSENLETVFESFERVDGDLDKQYPGIGLGLNISKKLVELHGGHIQIESEFGLGTTVTFQMPLADAERVDVSDKKPLFQKFNPVISRFAVNETRTQIYSQRSTDKNYFKIMVVDDDPVVRQVLSNYLTVEKFNICLATDGAEALELFEKEKPDIVLLDIMMPGLNGFEVCEAIRESRSQSETPVIFLSARNEQKDRIHGISVAANDYLEKPIFKNELIARIQNQISIMMANRRLNALLQLSEKIGKFKDVREMLDFAFQILDNNIYTNGVMLCQGRSILRKSGEKKTLQVMEKTVLNELQATEKLTIQTLNDPVNGYLIYHNITGFEEYSICLFRRAINGEFQKSDLEFISSIIREIHLIRSNIVQITHKHNRKNDIQKITRHLDRILYIEAAKASCRVIMEKPAGSFDASITMQEVDMYFGGYDLTRIHRRYFASLEKASSLQMKKSKDYDLIMSDFSIPVGRTYLKKLKEKHSYLF